MFAREDGTPIHPDFFSQTFDRNVAKINVPKVVALHEAGHAVEIVRAGLRVIKLEIGMATGECEHGGFKPDFNSHELERINRRIALAGPAAEHALTGGTNFDECEADLAHADMISAYLNDPDGTSSSLLTTMVGEYSTEQKRATVEVVAEFALQRQPLSIDDLNDLNDLIGTHLSSGGDEESGVVDGPDSRAVGSNTGPNWDVQQSSGLPRCATPEFDVIDLHNGVNRAALTGTKLTSDHVRQLAQTNVYECDHGCVARLLLRFALTNR